MHVHVDAPDGNAKYWLEPTVALAVAYELTVKELNVIERIVREHQDDFRDAWRRHFVR